MAIFISLHEWDTLHSCWTLFPKGERSWCWENCAVITIKALYLHRDQPRWPLTFLIVVFTVQCSSSQSWWLLVGGTLGPGCLMSTLQHFNTYWLWACSCTENVANTEGFVVRTELCGMANALNTMSVQWAHKNMLRVQGFRCWELPLLKVLTIHPRRKIIKPAWEQWEVKICIASCLAWPTMHLWLRSLRIAGAICSLRPLAKNEPFIQLEHFQHVFLYP